MGSSRARSPMNNARMWSTQTKHRFSAYACAREDDLHLVVTSDRLRHPAVAPSTPMGWLQTTSDERQRHPLLAAGTMVALVGVAVSAAAMSGSITLIHQGVQELMGLVTGSCGGNGPESITTKCAEGDTTMLTIGIFGVVGSVFLLMGFTAAVRGPTWATFCLMFAGLCGAVGANFYSYGHHDPLNKVFPGEHINNSGWTTGAWTFWVCAAGALAAAALVIWLWTRRAFPARGQPGVGSVAASRGELWIAAFGGGVGIGILIGLVVANSLR
jgi:hypothetical protein